MRRILFITGTDTGVGKTVLTALMVRALREHGVNAAALKPLCSGGRDDARQIHSAMDGALTLDEINPWHFRAPIAPLLAARMEHQKVTLPKVIAHVRRIAKRFEIVLVEGAGGLLSPLGEGFDSRDLISKLNATPIIVAQNKLGMVNQTLLTLEALPTRLRHRAKVVAMESAKADASSKSNLRLLAEWSRLSNISVVPRLGKTVNMKRAAQRPLLKKVLLVLADITL